MARSAQSRTKATAPAGRRPTKEASAKPAGEPKGKGAVRTPKARTTAAPQRPAAGAKRPAGSANRPAAPATRPAAPKSLVAKKPAAKSSAPKATSAPKKPAPKREVIVAKRSAKAPTPKATATAKRSAKAPARAVAPATRPAIAPVAKAAKAKRPAAVPAPKAAITKRPTPAPVLVAVTPKPALPVAKVSVKAPVKPRKSAAKMPATKRTTVAAPATSLSPFGLLRPLGLASQARQLAAASERLAERRERDLLPHRIETTRLVLRAPIRGDVPALARLADNPRIAANLTRLPSPYTRNDAVAFVEVIAQRADGRPYAISRDGELLGVIGLTFKLGQPPELGYWLGEPHWGKGIMTEAVRGIIEAVREKGTFTSLVSRALADNAASLRVLEKTGFKATEHRRETDGPHKDREIVVLRLELGR